jgi:hypothetical protein
MSNLDAIRKFEHVSAHPGTVYHQLLFC